jgi:hypothetical protein
MAGAAMDSAVLNCESRGRMPGETCVQGYLDEVIRFREQWQRFAVGSAGLWERFRSHGALLPAEFLTELERLQSQRVLLLQRIREGTASTGISGWRMPADDASLVDVEEALKVLLRHCRESERQFRLQQQSAVQLLQSAAGLRSAVPEVQVRLQELQQEARRELVLLEGCRYGEEAQLVAVVQPWQSLYLLIVDGQRGRGQLPWVSALPELAAVESEQHFAAAESRFERGVAVHALRGLVQLGADSEACVTAALYPDRGADQQRASVQQLEDLKQRFSEKSGGVVRAEAVTAAVGQRAVMPSAAGAVVQPVAVQGTHQANLAELESLQKQVGLAAQGSGAATEFRELLQMLGESIQFVAAILTARGGNRGQQADVLEQSLQMLAEAQSMLRHWQEQHQPGQASPLQVQIFHWLKNAVAPDAEGILLHRYMKLSDVADSRGCGELRERIRAASVRWHQSRQRSQNLFLLLGAIDHLEAETATNGWVNIDRFYQRFISSGGATDDPEVRERLSAKLQLFPELDGEGELQPAETGYSDALLNLLRAMQAELDERTLTELEGEREVSEALSEEVATVRQLLSGRRMAMVGGVVRPRARERIERAFGLAHLEWIPASKRDRVRDLEPLIRGANVLVLVTSIIGHKHNELRPVCAELGIPWVQTTKGSGYGVNQLAHAIMQQASKRLQEERDR